MENLYIIGEWADKMKKISSIIVAFVAITVILISFNSKDASTFNTEYENAVEYHITASRLDLDAVNSYPQKVIEVHSEKPKFDLNILVKNKPYNDIDIVEYKEYQYQKDIAEFLEPSAKIESDSKVIQELSDTFVSEDSGILAIASKAAKWTSQNIEYDKSLASRISFGVSDTRSALDTIVQKAGTCAEYTNVFIAVMRNKGIPARFISGYIYGGMYHAWAEIYLCGYGWIPVDPQSGKIGIQDTYIKLFYGKDFADINVKLNEINIYVEEIKH